MMRDSRLADVLRAAAPPAIVLMLAGILLRFPPAQYNFYPVCPIHELLGLQCPGCGATRAVAALLRGHMGEAMHLNALVTLALPFATFYCAVCYRRFIERKAMRWPQPPRWLMHAGFSAVAIFTVIRNLTHGPL
jgi:hypothetical protein